MFDEQFVYCGICHRRNSKSESLNLTSCAHMLCSTHWNANSSRCAVCNASNVSVIRLDGQKQLPADINVFFEPIQDTLETIYNVSQFQIVGLMNQCRYYEGQLIKMQEKLTTQKDLLMQAKVELDNIPALKQKISRLENQLAAKEKKFFTKQTPRNPRKDFGISSFSSSSAGQNMSSVFSNLKNPKGIPPATVDLTLDDENDRIGSNEEESFLRKLKRNSNLMKRINNTPPNGNPSLNVYQQHSNESHIAAESTHIIRGGSQSRENSNDVLSKQGSALKFPPALEKLRVIRRNNTVNSLPSRNHFTNSQSGIINHMKSSSMANVKQKNHQLPLTSHKSNASNGSLKNTIRSNTSEPYQANSKFRRIR